ncbi:methyltransferase domain-containing protein [Candidatus Saccharibacteria bacterium TM7i]|nr:methyltransferase domain-containing protein [Candidatus Saccharibacteria bacterium TM7i]
MKRNTQTHSQNFLRSPKLVAELLRKSSIKSSDTVYDIGAGSGVITSVLAPCVAEVVAIEVDPKTADILRRNVEEIHKFKNVTIIEKDFLSLPLPKNPYKIFSNIPFHISAKIVRRLFNTPFSPEAAYLIVQKQFGQKLISSDTKRFTSQIGMLLGAEYAIKIIKNLNKTDFTPAPAVDTVFIELKKRPQPLVERSRLPAYEAFTERCFSDPRFLAKQHLELIGATPGLSPSRLSLSQWLLLFNASELPASQQNR